MQFLAICRRRTEAFSPEAFDAVLDDEAERVRELFAEGFVRSAWTREDTPGACLLLESDSLEETSERLATLPLMAKGMLEVSVIPLRGYRGFHPRK
jgi:muconolactone delta-isomerase